MKTFLIRAFVLMATALSFQAAHAQNSDINPNLKWRFVISHELGFQSGNFLTYEFPAEKNYDYIFNITHNKNNLHAVIMVYDLQDKLIDKMVLEDNQLSIDLPFDVEESATYRVVIGLTDPNGKKGDILPAQFSLIRRVKVK